MLRLLRFLVTGDWHLHEWETIRTVDIVAFCGATPSARDYECRCIHCGKIKGFRV